MEKPSGTIRILLAENQTLLRAGLRQLLAREPDLKVVAEAADADAAVRLAAAVLPDILLLALALPKSGSTVTPGFPDVMRRLASSSAPPRTIVLASEPESVRIAEALKLGARGAVFNDSPSRVLIQSIRSVMQGKWWAGDGPVDTPAAAVRNAVNRPSRGAPPKTFGLTRRELDIVSASVSGYSNREIAGKFSISEDTVKHHLTHIYDKVGVYNRLELALFAIHHGLVGAEEQRQ
jgi:two-component system nitrate/nitrite response regulator NarL